MAASTSAAVGVTIIGFVMTGGGGDGSGGWEVGGDAPVVWVWAAREATGGIGETEGGLAENGVEVEDLEPLGHLVRPTLQPCFC